MAHEASLPGIEASLRCAMVKPNSGASNWLLEALRQR